MELLPGAKLHRFILRKIFILQKEAHRLMLLAGNRAQVIPLFVSANVLTPQYALF